jgi:hypothetical protein
VARGPTMQRRAERVRALGPGDEAGSAASAPGASVQALSSLSLSSSARWKRRCISAPARVQRTFEGKSIGFTLPRGPLL